MPTHGFLERRAGALARKLLGWLRSRVEPGSREWLDALAAESECADNGRQRLRWALGAVPLAFAINKRDQTNDTARGPMRALFAPGIANVAAIAGWYALIIPATYGAARSLRCTLFFGDQPGGCQEHPFVFGAIVLGGAILGMITALALRANSRRIGGPCFPSSTQSDLFGFSEPASPTCRGMGQRSQRC